MKALEKLIKARNLLQQAGLKKSGKNSFAGYGYFELADFLPEINRLSEQLGFACTVSFTAELASLIFHDLESDDLIMFTSPMSTASLKGSHEVQNLGAVQTYLKRYLYMHAFEIVEADVLDATLDPVKKPEPKKIENIDLQAEAKKLTEQLGLSEDAKKRYWLRADKNTEKYIALLKEEADKQLEVF